MGRRARASRARLTHRVLRAGPSSGPRPPRPGTARGPAPGLSGSLSDPGAREGAGHVARSQARTRRGRARHGGGAARRRRQIRAERKRRADVTAPGGGRAAGPVTGGADGAYVSPWKPNSKQRIRELLTPPPDPATWPGAKGPQPGRAGGSLGPADAGAARAGAGTPRGRPFWEVPGRRLALHPGSRRGRSGIERSAPGWKAGLLSVLCFCFCFVFEELPLASKVVGEIGFALFFFFLSSG